MGGPLVERLAWDEVAHRMKAGAAAILPIGAGAKEHGLHLPMGTDSLQALWLAERLAEGLEADTLVWPVVTYGYYPAFTAYPGSVSLTEETFRSLIAELAGGLIAQGAQAVIVLDTGISTIRPVSGALAGVDRALHLRIHAGPRYTETANRLRQQRFGSHADELETSRMLELAPDVVHMARAQASPEPPGGPRPGPLTPDDPSSPNYSPSGSFGDPTLATREKGEALIAAMLEDMIAASRAHLARVAAIR